MMRLPRRASVFGRLTMATIAVALASVALLFGVTYWTAQRAATRSLAATLDTDLAGLVDIYASGGRAELIARVDDREALVSQAGRTSFYLVADGAGRRIAGNVAAWPQLSAPLSEQGYVTLASGVAVYARVTRLAPDLELMVARSYERDSAMLRRLSLLFAGVGAAIVAIVAALARITARRLARRVEAINRAFRAAEDGHSAPIGAAQAADEIGELADHAGHMLARMAQLVETQRHVTDHVAHEIRTPLMHLDTQLVGALRRSDDAGRLAEAREEIRRITTLLDSLLDIASNEARRGDPAGLVELDLGKLVADVAALYEGSMEDAGLTLVTDIAPGVAMMAEPMQISRILSNLLDNAIKYVPPGGTVRVVVAPGPRISVIDDGPGIATEARAHIFERFTRAAPALQMAGHGLGLALARAIAERHGMTLRLADSPSGAHFVMEPA